MPCLSKRRGATREGAGEWRDDSAPQPFVRSLRSPGRRIGAGGGQWEPPQERRLHRGGFRTFPWRTSGPPLPSRHPLTLHYREPGPF